ncbi:MAG: DUF3224 domain-containing protein [Thermoanaerobaculia bacterium]|nr:DUF3224 domain-containing protein [Thermoanaerobaculia bacterium]
MKNATTACLCLALAVSLATAVIAAPPAQEKTMHLAKGEFDVQVTPRELDGAAPDETFSRFALTKQLRGDLVATGAGQMLAAGGPQSGAGAYVAIERLTGSLDGKTGSFALQHRGTMDATGMEMHITVVPESGTGDLKGIRGTFRILFDGPKHLYEFEYELPGAETH